MVFLLVFDAANFASSSLSFRSRLTCFSIAFSVILDVFGENEGSLSFFLILIFVKSGSGCSSNVEVAVRPLISVFSIYISD